MENLGLICRNVSRKNHVESPGKQKIKGKNMAYGQFLRLTQNRSLLGWGQYHRNGRVTLLRNGGVTMRRNIQ